MAKVRSLNFEEKNPTTLEKVRNLLDALKVHESLFALPFAYVAMLIAADGIPTWTQFIFITLGMIGARNFGMAMNQIIDKKIDSVNPHNMNRHLPSGRVGILEMSLFSIAALVLFVFSAWKLGSLPFILVWPATAYMILYSYTKRFTWAANLILGSVLAIGPGGAWIGVTGSFSINMLILCTGVFLWASAFDILYHIRSRDFYLEYGLHSIPQVFGIKTALNWSRAHDCLAVAAFILVGIMTQISWPYYLGIMLVSIILTYKHVILIPFDETKINRTFFRFNAMISIAVLSFTFIAVVLK